MQEHKRKEEQGKAGWLATAVLSLAALVGSLAGCGSQQASSSGGSSAPQNGNSSNTASTGSSSASSGYDFYKGKTLQIIVPYSPGGGYDQWARLIAPYMQKYLGTSKVEVVNVDGGGGLVGTNQIYAAKPDGLTIGDTNAGGDVFDQIAGAPGMQFDVSKFNWIGRPDDDPHIIAVHPEGPYKTFEDLEHAKETVKALATGKGSSDYNSAVITFNAFHIPHTMVAAFSGSKDEKAAFLRGNGDTCSLSASDVKQIADKSKVVVLQSTRPFDKLPGVPTVIDLAKQAGLSQDKIDGLTAMANVMDMGHAFFAPPGVPADRLAALREAFQKSLQDPAFQAEATKAGLYLGYASGDDLEKMTQDALSNATLLKPLLKD
ncbi:MAG: hypothetical protein K6T81_05340 [Alicyclobacillus macrosporangiidus]|uniref:Bug family tripartite tricarboxylate transporter substrate binding protein n=1 Tax=Alicyclobacillus macrosporangiidus TaxID=392015 RepID=UPI0026F0E9ED|nr:tripartite tricarboxylate transporter substrate-binding protein [Alicyclobacillus macrosporangiidus]MCL6598147.1 hypothetical protein [Alicyclobacillus macrosporangiidus]